MAYVLIGTAGWTVSSRYKDIFAAGGSQLERYAAYLDCVEINSSFYRPHRRETYERWAASTPDRFRFAVKLPREITHERRLAGCGPQIETFLGQAGGLGGKLSVILIQTPPNLRFDAAVLADFLRTMRENGRTKLAFEPRHASWASGEADALFREFGAARVLADPPAYQGAKHLQAERGLAYFRMHGAPKIYYSDYAETALDHLAREIEETCRSTSEVWCIFDNTAEGHALGNALSLNARLTA